MIRSFQPLFTFGGSEQLYVLSVLSTSPLSSSMFMEGDMLLEINGKSVVGWDHDKIEAYLEGPKGSPVSVTVKRDGNLVSAAVNREHSWDLNTCIGAVVQEFGPSNKRVISKAKTTKPRYLLLKNGCLHVYKSNPAITNIMCSKKVNLAVCRIEQEDYRTKIIFPDSDDHYCVITYGDELTTQKMGGQMKQMLAQIENLNSQNRSLNEDASPTKSPSGISLLKRSFRRTSNSPLPKEDIEDEEFDGADTPRAMFEHNH